MSRQQQPNKIDWEALTPEAREAIEAILEDASSYGSGANPESFRDTREEGESYVVDGVARYLAGVKFLLCLDDEQVVYFEEVAEEIEGLLGYTSEELKSGVIKLEGLLTPDSLERLREANRQESERLLQQERRGEICWGAEIDLIHKSGELCRVRCLLMSRGEESWRGVLMDMRAEERSARRVEKLLERDGQGLCLCDVSGRVLRWNTALEKLWSANAWKGLEAGEGVRGRLHAEIEWAMNEGMKLASEGVGFERLCRLDARQQEEAPWFEVQVLPILDERGQVFEILISVSDLTPRIHESKEMEGVLRKLELRQEVLSQLPIAIALVDRHWKVRKWMTHAPRNIGLGDEPGVDVRACFLNEEGKAAMHFERLERASGEEVLADVWESVCIGRDGTTVPVRVRVKRVQLGEDLVEDAIDSSERARQGWMVLIEDIRLQRELEEELRQAQKLEALGMLTGGMTHDLNNLLTVILGHLELAEGELSPGHTVRMDLEGIRAAVERASALTVKLLAFARAQITELQVVDILEVVTQVRPLLVRTLSEDMRLLLRLDPRTHLIRVDAVQLEQLLINLVVNARDALIEGKGEVVITTERRKIRMDRKAVGGHRIPPGEYVILSVIDNGEGISATNLGKIFEPFFTTKAEGHGTGLGLSTCMRIVKQNNGYMRCESKPGVGTIFEIWLPLVESGAHVDVSLISSHEIELARDGTTVLLVEDDRPLRETLRRSLETHGYRVYEARHGRAALELIERLPQPPDLIVTDVAMPDMGGVALFEQVQQRGLNIPVLFMSGYSDELCPVSNLSQRQHFVSKPFTPKRLVLHVQNCLQFHLAPQGS